jgi:hypothetical protein
MVKGDRLTLQCDSLQANSVKRVVYVETNKKFKSVIHRLVNPQALVLQRDMRQASFRTSPENERKTNLRTHFGGNESHTSALWEVLLSHRLISHRTTTTVSAHASMVF